MKNVSHSPPSRIEDRFGARNDVEARRSLPAWRASAIHLGNGGEQADTTVYSNLHMAMGEECLPMLHSSAYLSAGLVWLLHARELKPGTACEPESQEEQEVGAAVVEWSATRRQCCLLSVFQVSREDGRFSVRDESLTWEIRSDCGVSNKTKKRHFEKLRFYCWWLDIYLNK